MPVEDISFNDMQFNARSGAVIKEANNISFHNVRITTQQGSSIIAEKVTNLAIDGLKTLKPVTAPLVTLTNTKNVFVYNCFPVQGTDVFLHVKGANSSELTLRGNNFKHAYSRW